MVKLQVLDLKVLLNGAGLLFEDEVVEPGLLVDGVNCLVELVEQLVLLALHVFEVLQLHLVLILELTEPYFGVLDALLECFLLRYDFLLLLELLCQKFDLLI